VKARLLRVVKILAFPAFYLLCLLLFGYLTFPYGRLRDRVIVEIEKRGKPGQRLEIGKLGSYWLTGVTVTGVKLHLPADDKEAPLPGADFGAVAAPAKESVLVIDEAHARVRLLPLLLGRVRVDFWASAFGGEITGSAPLGSAQGEIEVEVDRVDLSKIEPLGQLIGVPIKGTASGKLTLEAPEGKLNKANGALDVKVADAVVSDGKTKIQGLIELPPARLGDLVLTAEAKDGTLKVTKLAADGTDLEIVGDGKLALREPWNEVVADVFVRFKFTDVYRVKSATTKSLLGEPGSNLPPLMEIQVPKMKRAKRPDGFYGWHITGPLKRLRYEPTTTDFAGASPAAVKPGAPEGGSLRRPPGSKRPMPLGTPSREEPAAVPAPEGAGRPERPARLPGLPHLSLPQPAVPAPEAPPPPPPPPPPQEPPPPQPPPQDPAPAPAPEAPPAPAEAPQ
jgi:type II secretion system protein N